MGSLSEGERWGFGARMVSPAGGKATGLCIWDARDEDQNPGKERIKHKENVA